ncbi:uncharacterized protein TNIN_49851 [Trichonephila inaurata madagascariensis]|uniref:Uncharacterized protein n=1 Tax=Trichonephila inaurata madagascariensis TaxID=2747483 RepID=A0A8X6JAG5_9ARAC|nr:uncharacterized protein TNIN_49851 [Trichonephila inaurata madagascariensis]
MVVLENSNVVNAIQQVQVQLNSLETESQRHSSRIQDVLRATTRLEAQRQEFIGILDRSESHLSQRLEDVKGDVRKVR